MKYREERIKLKEEQQKSETNEYMTRNRISWGFNVERKIKFNGNVKMIHPKVFINTLKNKVRNIGNNEVIKEIIRNNLIDNAGIWFASQ